MPNHVANKLTIFGDKETLKKIREFVSGERPQTKETPGSCNYTDKPPYKEIFSFNKIIPLPQSYSENTYNDHGWDLERQYWGVKWGAYDVIKPKLQKNSLTYQFNTAWSPPIKILIRLSEMFPETTIILSVGGELHDGRPRRWSFKNGKSKQYSVDVSDFAINNHPESEDELDEDYVMEWEYEDTKN